MNTRVLASFVAALWAGGALGQVSPPAVIEPVAHEGDPAPGIPGFTLYSVGTAQVDGAGNVLFPAFLDGPEVEVGNARAIFYGPPGNVQKLFWESEQAPDMPAGVIISDILTAGQSISEVDGWISLTLTMSGPGIETDVNDRAFFVGPPGDFRKVLQGGDQAPGCEPGVYIDCASSTGFGGRLSDNGTLYVVADLAGPGVTGGNDRARWIGTRDHLELVYRDGMQAPGCEPGVLFAGASYIAHNDAGQFSFRGLLIGPGVTSGNNLGHWLGGPGTLAKITRKGDQVPGMDPGVTWATVANSTDVTNTPGDIGEPGIIEGPGVTEDDDYVFFVGDADELYMVSREGDPAPEAGPGVYFQKFGGPWINNRTEVLYRVKYAGAGITDSNAWAMYFGPLGAGELTLRDGDPAPTFPPDVLLSVVNNIPSLVVMNDVGDIIAPTEITGPGVTDDDKVVLWLRHHVLQRWVPLLRSGSTIGGRTVYAAAPTDFGYAYYGPSGGADGQHQSMNDLGMLTIGLEFTDGTEGIFRISPPVFGDANCDATLDEADIAPFVLLLLDRATYDAQYPGNDADAICDLDGNAAVDGGDIEMFVALLGA